jgi:hypothetical protein
MAFNTKNLVGWEDAHPMSSREAKQNMVETIRPLFTMVSFPLEFFLPESRPRDGG